MKLVLVSSSQPRASLCGGRRGPFASFGARQVVGFNSRLLSVCVSCRAANSGIVIPSMSNACSTSSCSLRQKAVKLLSSRKLFRNVVSRPFSTWTLPSISLNFPVVIRCPSSLGLATKILACDVSQRSVEWFALRRDKLTTSTFSTALGFWKGTRRPELWHEKVFDSQKEFPQTSQNAMQWGVLNEDVAIEKYKIITGREVGTYGFAIHEEERFGWLGASPDGLLDCFQGGGILEVKCPYNKGKPEKGLPWSTMPFYYMPQVQGQMEIMDRDWVDLYCWTPNGSTIFRVIRDPSYWELMHEILREFWWENVVPAKEALLLGDEEKAKQYIPTSTHKKTGLAIVKSLKLASESRLLCREIAGHTEFF